MLISSSHAVMRMRAADAMEKVSAIHPTVLQSPRRLVLDRLLESDAKDICWHAAQMLPRVQWPGSERPHVYTRLVQALDDPSRSVAANALQALVDLMRQWPERCADTARIVRRSVQQGSSALRARARKLVAVLDAPATKE